MTGAETFFRDESNENLNLADDIAFATAVHKGVIDGMRTIDAKAKDRGVKPDTQSGPGALGVLNDKRLGNDKMNPMCVSAYIEGEFITNQKVDTLLISGPNSIANRTTVMASLAKSIRTHLKLIAS